LRRLVLERLMRYHRYLTETRDADAPEAVTSAEIAEALDIDPTQVRKDLGSVGVRGQGRVGFDAGEAVHAIRRALAFDQIHLAVVVGTGHLGGALMAYHGFARYGLRIAAAFDNDDEKVGREVAGCAGCVVRHTRGMGAFIKRHKIKLAILTTPAPVSQKIADRLVAAGVTAIWNFSPTRLTVPEGVFVRNEHISLGLSELAYHLKN
jgi:redox-sensing transcriptional repressor